MRELLTIFRMTGLRHAVREPRQTFVLVAILTLGVATLLSVRMTNRAGVDSFSRASDWLADDATLVVRSASGRIAQQDLPLLRDATDPLPVPMLAMIESFAVILPSERGAQVIGIDYFTAREALSDVLSLDDDQRRLDTTGVYVTRAIASENNLDRGSVLRLRMAGQDLAVPVAGILPVRSANRPLPSHLVVFDLPLLQSLTRDSRFVDRVEILFDGDLVARARLSEFLRENAPPDWIWMEPGQERVLGAQISAAFRLNLLILSMVALLTGLYLILMGLDAAVSRRRLEMAIMRSLGLLPRQIRRLWLVESAMLGLLASVVGLLAGWYLARLGQGSVQGTLSAFYGASGEAVLTMTAGDVVAAVCLGVGGSLLAGWFPSRDAAGTPPAQLLRQEPEAPAIPGFKRPLPGLVLLAIAGCAALLPPASPSEGQFLPLPGYFSAFAALIGGAMLAGQALPLIGRLLGQLQWGAPWWRWSVSKVARAGQRRMLSVAGVFVATGMAASIVFLVQSFEGTLEDWMEVRFRGDIYVSPAGFRGSPEDRRISAATAAALAAVPGVAELDPSRLHLVYLDGRPVHLQTARFDLLGSRHQLMRLASLGEWSETSGDPPVWISENLSWRRGMSTGERINLPVPGSTQSFEVIGIHADFSNDQGSVLIDHERFAEFFGSDDLTNATLYLEPGRNSQAFAAELRKMFPQLEFRSAAELREAALDTFGRTFAVTRGLQAIGLFVALAGIVLGMLIHLRQSRDELQTLQRLGMGRRQLAKATALEGAVWAFTGMIAGMVLSLFLGWLLIHRINRPSFGWTLQAHYPLAEILVWGAFLLLTAALLAGVCGWRSVPRHSAFASRPSTDGLRRSGQIGVLAILYCLLPADGLVVASEAYPVPQPWQQHGFPAAHGSHPDFRIEWWYLTGQLDVQDGEGLIGYQATFFRFRDQPPLPDEPRAPQYAAHTFHLAHMALSDVANRRYRFEERIQREGWDAWAEEGRLNVRNSNWRLWMEADGSMRLTFSLGRDVQVDLRLLPAKPLIIFGEDGTSRKGPDADARSYYFSFSRIYTEGSIRLEDENHKVAGLSWMDHEIASRQLGEHLQGWDWTAIHLDDGRDIKAYVLRHPDGSADEWSRLMWIDGGGHHSEHDLTAFTWEFGPLWKSPLTGVAYHNQPTIRTTDPKTGHDMVLRIVPWFPEQEFLPDNGLAPYWEGACKVLDENGEVIGRAYLELVGYGGRIEGL